MLRRLKDSCIVRLMLIKQLRTESTLSRQALLETSRSNSHRNAIQTGSSSITYRTMQNKSEHIQRQFKDEGRLMIDSCRRIAILLPFHSPNFMLTCFTSILNESCFLPLNPSHPASLLQYFLGDFKPDLVVTDNSLVKSCLDLLKSDKTSPNVLVLKETCFGEVDCEVKAERDQQTIAGNSDELLVLYTSGTTSKPKGVLHTQRSIGSQVSAMSKVWNWNCADRIVQVLPLHHVHGMVNCLLTPMMNGACIMPEHCGRFDAEKVLNELIFGDSTLFMAVPTVYSKLLHQYESKYRSKDDKEVALQKFSRLRLVVSGSASLPQSVYNRFKQATGHCLVEQYGSTEMGRCMSVRPGREHKPGNVGQPMPGVDIKLVDPDCGHCLFDSTIQPQLQASMSECGEKYFDGELFVRGPGMFKEYLNKPAFTTEAIKNGYFQTGDMARLHLDNNNQHYSILGRLSVDIIKSGGYKISALDVERVLLDHPLIQECTVVGVKDETWGEIVTAIVYTGMKAELSNNSMTEECHRFCMKWLPKYSCPRQVVVVEEPLPRNAIGKINKKALVNELFPQGFQQ